MGIEWSILLQGYCTATALFMNEEIDEGSIIHERNFLAPKLEYDNIPQCYSPHIRSEVLIECLQQYLEAKKFSVSSQLGKCGGTYHKMHPSLNAFVLNRI